MADDHDDDTLRSLLERAIRDEKARNFSRVSGVVEFGTRLTILIVGACYAVGLLIVNLHLGQYGIYNLGFLQAQYVMAGALWLFLVGGTTGLLAIAVSQVRSGYQKARSRPTNGLLRAFAQVGVAIGESLLVIVAEMISWLLLVGFLSGYQVLPLVAPSVALRMLGVLTFGAVAWAAAFGDVRDVADTAAYLSFWQRHRAALKPIVGNALPPGSPMGRRVFELSIRVATNIAAISLYALYVFPYFPPAVGGGRMQKIAFTVGTDHAELLKGVGLRTTPDGRMVEPLDLIFESSEAIVVAPAPGSRFADRIRSVRIRKDLVAVSVQLRELALHLQGYYADTGYSVAATPTATSSPSPSPSQRVPR